MGQATTGVEQAVNDYGVPEQRAYTLDVQKKTIEYWKVVSQKRKAEAVLVLRRRDGRYLVHTKVFYPQGLYRLLSGGVKIGEDLTKAVYRETWEETGLEARIERFLGILSYRFLWQGQSVPLTSFIFLLAETGGTLQPQDHDEPISGFREVDLAGLLVLAEELESLPEDWKDWGEFRAIAHRFVAEVLAKGDTRT